MKIFPVVIPTLCRYEHFKRCVESLSNCSLASETELVIGLDYPANESHVYGYNLIVEYLKILRGFKKVTVLTTDINLGAEKNLERLYDYVYQSYDALIMTEDDNEFSPCFLEFMNYSLNAFKDNPFIMTISGYTSMSYYGVSKCNLLLTHDTSAWGFGMWKCKSHLYIETGMVYYHKIATSINKSFKIFKKYPFLLLMLLSMLIQKKKWGDTMYTSYNIINGLYQLRPSVSMVRNWGQDGTGVHSGIDNSFKKQQIQCERRFSIESECVDFSYKEVKRVNRCSFWMGLPKNKIQTCYVLIRIFCKWVCYQVKHPNYEN